MRRRWKLWLAVVLGAIVLFALLEPTTRCTLYGWLAGEPTYRGMPVSYWRRVILMNSLYHRSLPKTSIEQIEAELWDLSLEVWPVDAQTDLFTGDPAAVPVVCELLNDREVLVVCDTITAVPRFGPHAAEAIPAMLAVLDRTGPYPRALVYASLKEIKPQSELVMPTLTARLDREEGMALVELLEAMAVVSDSDEERVQALVQILEWSRGIGTRRGPKGFPADSSFALNAVRLLGEMGPRARPAADALRSATRDPNPRLAQVAAEALQRIEGPPNPP